MCVRPVSVSFSLPISLCPEPSLRCLFASPRTPPISLGRAAREPTKERVREAQGKGGEGECGVCVCVCVCVCV